MTVQPAEGSGYVDYPTVSGGPPQLVPEESKAKGVYTPESTKMSLKQNKYRKGGPVVTSMDLWGTNGYYMNGPYVDPFERSGNTAREIDAYTKTWSNQAKFQSVNNFVKLVGKYGHTNSPGVLWSMAMAEIPATTDIGSKILQADAREVAIDAVKSAPVTGQSPSAQNETDNPMDGFWKPIEFLARNSFAAMSMPMEAVQGTLGGIGGELTQEGAPLLGMEEGRLSGALAQVGSLLIPPVSLWADRTRGDNAFTNPWEQTEFGQTLLSMANGKGFSAFTTEQAGLDVDKAKEELRRDPAYAALEMTTDGVGEFNSAAVALAKDKGYYGDPGWFIDETSRVGEAQRRATFEAWAIPGPDNQMTSWTTGRGIASNVAGPDWVGYGVMSGLIDAVMAVAVDPTIVGSKFGLPSKSLRGIGRVLESAGVEGAEKTLTVGRESRKIQESYGLTMRQVDKAVGEVNAARAAAGLPLITAEDVATMDIIEMTDVVREAKIAAMTDEYKSALRVDTDLASRQARQMRRAAGRASIIDESILRDVNNAGEDISADIQFMQEYRDVLFRKGPKGEVTLTSRERNAVPGTSPWYAFRDQISKDPEMADRYNRLMSEYNVLFTDGDYGDDVASELQSVNDFIDVLSSRNKVGVNRADDVDPAKVQRDIARVYASATSDAEEAYVINSVYDGLTLTDELNSTRPIIASANGKPGIAYWAGDAEPVFANAKLLIPVEQAGAILARLTDFLSRPNMSGLSVQINDLGDADGLAAQTMDILNRSADPREQLTAILTSGNATYEKLLEFSQKAGIDSILDDVLRSEAGIDGISGVDKASGRGAWMGNHPSVIAYGISTEGKQIGKELARVNGSAGIDFSEVGPLTDIEEALSQVDFSNLSSEVLDLRGMGVADLQQMAYDSLQESSKYRGALDQLAQDSVFKAKTKGDALAEEIVRITDETSDPNEVLRRNLSYLGGMRNTKNGGIMLDQRGVREFLFGRGPASFLANRALDRISNVLTADEIQKAQDAGKFGDEFGNFSETWRTTREKAIGRLALLTGSKWFPDTYQSVIDAIMDGGGRESVLNILSTRIGIDVTKGSVSRTVAVTSADGPREFQTWRKLSQRAQRALGQMPTARTMNLQNANEVADSVILYGRYAMIAEEKLAEYVGRVFAADGTMESIGVNRNVIARVFDDISDVVLQRMDENAVTSALYKGPKGAIRKQEIRSAIRSSTRLWMGGETDANKTNLQIISTMSDVNRVVDSEANEFVLPDINIETELATGTLSLPSVDEWSKAISRFHTAVARFAPIEDVYDLGKKFFDNVFRAGLLAFRAAYIIRNVAEMQVRMFLNGHQSVISDPLTMIGMTFGSQMSGRRVKALAAERESIIKDITEELAAAGINRRPSKDEIEARMTPRYDLFNDLVGGPFKDTVLGTDFEVGDDINLALANAVDEYFALVRMSHSLTDPRVYNSAVRQGWQMIQYGTPTFNYGWAHELMMLHNSDIVRVMLDTPGVDFQRGYFNNDSVIDFLTGMDARAIAIRRKMIGADRKFEQIFNDRDLMDQWLFKSVNSVQNRINQFTRSDPRLISYLRSGRIEWDLGEGMSISSIGDSQKRMRDLGGILGTHFNDDDWAKHFLEEIDGRQIRVPWIDENQLRHGFGLFDTFFKVANKIERIGAVGPEFRMAYWDRIAELAPGLNASEIDRALKSARTTLSTIKRMKKDGSLDVVGSNHPAFAALSKAKADNTDGMMTLDDIHELAMSHASASVQELFYDAAKRNKFWYQLRLIFPFGQAWGNTAKVWTDLGKKSPIQVYKVQKGLNSLIESGSSEIYEFGQEIGAYADYAPGSAPWEQEANGGFFYTDTFGETSFMYPYLGKLQALAVNTVGAMRNGFSTGNFSGPGMPETNIQSPAQSLNMGFGEGSVLPGVAALGGVMLNTDMLPDNDVITTLRKLAMPYGEKGLLSAAVPAWTSKLIAGVGAIPFIGGALESALDGFAPANKDKHVRDSMLILSTSGNYPNWATDPQELQRMQEDAKSLAMGLLITTGLFQNVLPSTPVMGPNVSLAGEEFKGEKEVDNPQLYAVGIMNVLFQQYLKRNNRDYTEAHMEFVKDFGPAAIFATIGDWKSFGARPTSDALAFARKNPNIAEAYPELFTLFFPGGDSSDVAAIKFMRDFGSGVMRRKTVDEISTEVIGTLKRIQSERINSMRVAGLVSEDESDVMRDELDERYLKTDATVGVIKDKTSEMLQLNAMVNDFAPIRNSEAGQAFAVAWKLRETALAEARRFSGRDDTTLSGQKVAPIRSWFDEKIFELQDKYPDFELLGAKFRKEWN